MVFSSYGNSSSFYLPLDSDQGVTFYKNENSLFSPQPPTSVVCRRNQDNNSSTMSPNELPFGNNSHGTVVVDAVCQDFQPVAHLSSNGYYGYVPPKMTMMSTAVNAGTVSAACSDQVQLDCQTEDAAMDCGNEMENFHQLKQHQRKRKDYCEEATSATKRRKTWRLEEEQQAAGFPQTFGWNQLPYSHQQQQQQMDCVVEDTPMVVGSCNGSIVQTTSIPVAMVQPTVQQQMAPKNPLLVDGISSKRHSGAGSQRFLGRWNIAMPTSRPSGCSATGGHRLLLASEDDELSDKLHHHQQSIGIGFGGGTGQELEDLFVSLHGSGFFLAG